MNIKNQVYAMRKRIPDDMLLEIYSIVSEEIERRKLNDKRNEVTTRWAQKKEYAGYVGHLLA